MNIINKTNHYCFKDTIGFRAEIVVFLVSAIYFGLLVLCRVGTDLPAHAKYVRDVVAGVVPPPANFMYYLAVYLFSLGNVESLWWLGFSTVLLMGLVLAAKFAITRRLLAESLAEASDSPRQGWLSPERLSLLLAIALLFMENLPMRLFGVGNYYLGQIPPNVWHNSTTIFLMPFALLLFQRSWLQLQNPSNKDALKSILLLVVLNALVKPSFLFAFVTVYPVFMLRATARKAGAAKQYVVNMIPVAVAGVLVVALYAAVYFYSFNAIAQQFVGQSKVVVRPFLVWSRFSPNIPLSLMLSLVFPIVYLILHPTELCNEQLRYVWSLYVVSVLIFILFAETGPRLYHGNFLWQASICSYILFLVTCSRYGARLIELGAWAWRNVVLSLCLLVHLLSGLVYMSSILIQGSYH